MYLWIWFPYIQGFNNNQGSGNRLGSAGLFKALAHLGPQRIKKKGPCWLLLSELWTPEFHSNIAPQTTTTYCQQNKVTMPRFETPSFLPNWSVLWGFKSRHSDFCFACNMLLWSEVQYCYGTLVSKARLVRASTAPFSWFFGAQMRQSFEQSSTTESIAWPLVIVEPLNVRKRNLMYILQFNTLLYVWNIWIGLMTLDYFHCESDQLLESALAYCIGAVLYKAHFGFVSF